MPSAPIPSDAARSEGVAIPVLVSEVYRRAGPPLRTRLLDCLVRRMGPLGLAAVATGAFGVLLHRGDYRSVLIEPEDAHRFSAEQVFELARHVEQASPEGLLELMPLLLESPVGAVGVAAPVLWLALQAWRTRRLR